MATKSKEGDLRVWHIPQVPGKAFRVPVRSAPHAAEVLTLLAEYDAFQYTNKIKPDYCSMQGLEVFEDGEWCEWANDDGQDIGEVMRGERINEP